MEMKYYLRIIQRGWWIILLVILASVNTSLIVSFLMTPQYETTARFVVSPNSSLFTDTWDVVSSLDTLDRRSIINTYKEVLDTPSIYNAHPDISALNPNELDDYETVITVIPDTNIVQLTVTGPNPEKAVKVANAISTSSIGFINNLYPVYSFNVLNEPELPIDPVQPRPLQNVILALVAGAIIGVGLAFLRDQLVNTVESMRLRAIVDNVTTAYTKDYFEKRLAEEIEQHPEAVLSMGIINFRGIDEVKDVFPKAMINRGLQHLTQIVREELRGRDLVGKWDDTQLAVMLPATPGSAAENTFRRLQKILSGTLEFADSGDMVINPDPCVGISSNQNKLSAEHLVRETTRAAEKASAIQGDTVVYVEPLHH
jgi:diguanylate cyclase (GGDEF)-like protein